MMKKKQETKTEPEIITSRYGLGKMYRDKDGDIIVECTSEKDGRKMVAVFYVSDRMKKIICPRCDA